MSGTSKCKCIHTPYAFCLVIPMGGDRDQKRDRDAITAPSHHRSIVHHLTPAFPWSLELTINL